MTSNDGNEEHGLLLKNNINIIYTSLKRPQNPCEFLGRYLIEHCEHEHNHKEESNTEIRIKQEDTDYSPRSRQKRRRGSGSSVDNGDMDVDNDVSTN